MATGSIPPPHPDCRFISEGSVMPPDTQPVGAPYKEQCTKTIICVNKEDLRDVRRIDCPGKKECQDYHSKEEVVYACPNCKAGSNCPCAGEYYHRIPTAGSTKPNCKECVPDNPCNCPPGYMQK